MMNYLLELRAFKDWCLMNQPSTGQIALWHALMAMANASGWQEWFSVPNQTLELLTGLSHSGINKSRQILIDRGRIEYRPSDNRKRASRYKVVSFCISNKLETKVNELENEWGNELEYELGNELGTNKGTSESTINKLNNNKLNKTNLIINLTENEKEILNILKNIPNYPFDYEKDLSFIRLLAVDFPTVDILEQVKKYSTWLLDKPLKKKSNPRSQLRNWCKNSVKWGENQKPQTPKGLNSSQANAQVLEVVFGEQAGG